MPDRSVTLDQVRRYFEYSGADVDRAQELYHDDAVLEFPHRASASKARPTSPSGAAMYGGPPGARTLLQTPRSEALTIARTTI